MYQVSKLYDKPIFKQADESLTEQVYHILLKEILNARWQVGERMPSFNDFLDLSGLSRYPIENALNRLEKEGFINKIKQKGIFVKSNSPNGTSLGIILLVTESHSYQSPHNGTPKFSPEFGWVNASDIKLLLAEQGFRMETIDIKGDQVLTDAADLMPDGQVKGIISMVPAEKLHKIGIPQALPAVYLGINDSFSKPCISGDLFMASHALTAELIADGHKKISIFANNIWDESTLTKVVEGHTQAMASAGLEVNTASIDFTKPFAPQDLAGIRDFLKEFPDTTGILSLNVDNASKIVEYADLMNIKIPEDLSIASLQDGYMRVGDSKTFDGIIYDWEKILKLCQQVLFNSQQDIPINRYEFNFIIDPNGESIAPPKKGGK